MIRLSDNFIPRKITNTFIQKMMLNTRFKQEIEIFLNDELIMIHKTETNWKIHSLAKKWQSLMLNKSFDLFDGICKVIETDSKFKLPWTITEVEQAIANTKKQFGLTNTQ